MKLPTLYEIVGEYYKLYEFAIDEEDDQALIDTLEGLHGELSAKAAGCTHVIKQLEMEADECDKVIKAFQEKKKVRTNSIKRMKEAIMGAMDVAGLTELPAGEFTLKIAKNGGVQPMEITGEVPDNFLKVIYEADKDKIRQALKDGEELNFAHLEERGRHLNIK